MVPTLSPAETEFAYSPAQQQSLLQLARRSIEQGVQGSRGTSPDESLYAQPLREFRSSFVTLHRAGRLRGCIGNLAARRPLVQDVAENAYAAAFHDPRFAPVERFEVPQLHIHVSVLTPAEQLNVRSEAELLSMLQPGVDGLILEEGPYRSTFLPSVWEQLPDPRDFLHHLKLKAGLPADHWSKTLKVFRYGSCSFGETTATS